MGFVDAENLVKVRSCFGGCLCFLDTIYLITFQRIEMSEEVKAGRDNKNSA